ncbi:hypothetical protein Tco_1439486 [Tanacetum coccineum]
MGTSILTLLPETESDEFISIVLRTLSQSRSQRDSDNGYCCDVPLCNNPTSLEALNEHSEIVVNSNDANSSMMTIIPTDFPDCEDSRACSIHMSFTSSASVWESIIRSRGIEILSCRNAYYIALREDTTYLVMGERTLGKRREHKAKTDKTDSNGKAVKDKAISKQKKSLSSPKKSTEKSQRSKSKSTPTNPKSTIEGNIS